MKKAISIKIDKRRCKGCGLCILFCPKAVLGVSKELNKIGAHPAYVVNQSECTGCANCAVICPDLAIEISFILEEKKPSKSLNSKVKLSKSVKLKL